MKKQAMLILIIGIPGSGKSTLARETKDMNWANGQGARIRETDEYFVDPHTHEYNFDPSKLAEYHAECQKGTKRDLEMGYNVIVSNTNLTKWERKHYFDIARDTKSSVILIIMRKNHGNIHGIPKEKIEQMQDKFEEVSSDEFTGIDNVTFLTEEEVRKYNIRYGADYDEKFFNQMQQASDQWKGND